jgi:predicted aspartyl protease
MNIRAGEDVNWKNRGKKSRETVPLMLREDGHFSIKFSLDNFAFTMVCVNK